MCFIWVCTRSFARRHPKIFVGFLHPFTVIFVLVATVFFVVLQMFYVVPNLFKTDTLMYKLSWLVAIFITYNIFGNMLACHRTDTSVQSLPKDRQSPEPGEVHLWDFCDICEKSMPPRSWHCVLCNCCILKRDHHCIFTATCIGHNNQRYFFWFTFYMALGTFAALTTNTLVVLQYCSYMNLFFLNFRDVVGLPTWLFVTLFVNIYALAAPGSALIVQFLALRINGTLHDLYSEEYNRGIRRNFKMIVGKKGLWTFLSPTIKSALPHDGTKWLTKEKDISEC
ncbi:probable palmitoyltransferase ZDHHC24 [Drosophila subpulchrella]|uniref:probable palmitoyltransferase ZDHHC24 n=1 Tax=Drosophila subpulchrella TaxID=1486046 RepID=UPI0018A1B162|nr:probable palmitoyltransferase ZDHHC24 [Drosophila subpulchrella]